MRVSLLPVCKFQSFPLKVLLRFASCTISSSCLSLNFPFVSYCVASFSATLSLLPIFLLVQGSSLGCCFLSVVALAFLALEKLRSFDDGEELEKQCVNLSVRDNESNRLANPQATNGLLPSMLSSITSFKTTKFNHTYTLHEKVEGTILLVKQKRQ